MVEWSTAEGMINFVWGWILGRLQRRGVTQAGSWRMIEIFPDLWDVERHQAEGTMCAEDTGVGF